MTPPSHRKHIKTCLRGIAGGLELLIKSIFFNDNMEKLKWGYDPELSCKSVLRKGKWSVDIKGNICFDNYYEIDCGRLTEDNWIIHLMMKDWFDFNQFMPIYFQALYNAGIKNVSIKTAY